MLAYCHLLILMSSLASLSHVVLDVSRAVEGGVCLLIALLGNVMGKVRRNFFVGIRTPWTLKDTRVWARTHRFTGRLMVMASGSEVRTRARSIDDGDVAVETKSAALGAASRNRERRR